MNLVFYCARRREVSSHRSAALSISNNNHYHVTFALINYTYVLE